MSAPVYRVKYAGAHAYLVYTDPDKAVLAFNVLVGRYIERTGVEGLVQVAMTMPNDNGEEFIFASIEGKPIAVLLGLSWEDRHRYNTLKPVGAKLN